MEIVEMRKEDQVIAATIKKGSGRSKHRKRLLKRQNHT